VQEFKHLRLSFDAFKLFGHLMHSDLSMLNTENSSHAGFPLTVIGGLGLTIQFSLFGSGMDPGGHHSQQVSSQDLVFVTIKADAALVVKRWSGTSWAVNTSEESGVIESLVAST